MAGGRDEIAGVVEELALGAGGVVPESLEDRVVEVEHIGSDELGGVFGEKGDPVVVLVALETRSADHGKVFAQLGSSEDKAARGERFEDRVFGVQSRQVEVA